VFKAETRLTLNLTSQAIKLGDKVSISGKFTPQPDCGGGLAGIPLTLVIDGPGEILDIQSIQTNDPFGHFSIQEYTGFNALGEWTVQATFAGNNAYISTNSDQAKLKVVETAGYAIVVQGKHSSEEGLASHDKTAQFVYNELKDRGLLDEDIMYFNYAYNPDPEVRPDIDALPTKTGIQNAVTTWAAGKMNAKPANLYIIMVDHGLEDIFYIYPETITGVELSGWLDTLDGALSGQAEDQEIIVILGFCRSGSFIDDLSGENRAIIVSAAHNESSYKGPMDEDGIRQGEYFVAEFFKEVSFGKSVKECFEKATRLTKVFTRNTSTRPNAPYFDKSRQHPLLDDNGDGSGSNKLNNPQGDGFLSDTLFIGVSTITGNDPGDVIVTDVAPARFVEVGDETANLWAKVDNNDRLSTIWVEVKPPNYDPVGEGGSGQAEMDLTKTGHTYYDAQEDRYIWSGLGGFTDSGTYEVFYFAKDDTSGNVSPFMVSYVYKAIDPNQEPDSFMLLSPEYGEETLTSLVLDWEDSTDQDGDNVTYTVLLSKGDDSFSDPIRIEGLVNSTCLLDPSDGLEDLNTYYWKVQAIDEYGGVTESGLSMFYTDNTNLTQCFLAGYVYDVLTFESISDFDLKIGSRVMNVSATGGYYLCASDPGTYTLTLSAPGYEAKTYPGVSLPEMGMVERNFDLMDADRDKDGLPNIWEEQYLLDPDDDTGDDGANGDPDGDGLSNLAKYENDTDPTLPDTDDDGMPDGWEVDNGLEPDDSTGVNGADWDRDLDGWTNLQEYRRGTDPNDTGSQPSKAMPWLQLLLLND